jgi:histidinol-phosphate phosphatase family protein
MTQLELLPRASQAIRQINNSEFLSICVTNQSVIARNLCDLGELRQIHNQLETLLARDQAYLDHIYFCPHHPDSGYPEERAEYKIDCECRKPNTGLVLAAQEKYNLDLSRCYIIGDRQEDIQLGKRLGMISILVKTGRQESYEQQWTEAPDFVFPDLELAVHHILNHKRQ